MIAGLVLFGALSAAGAPPGPTLLQNADRPPRVGELLPDVAAVDEQGRPFPLRSLEGSPAVLVFGCLT